MWNLATTNHKIIGFTGADFLQSLPELEWNKKQEKWSIYFCFFSCFTWFLDCCQPKKTKENVSFPKWELNVAFSDVAEIFFV